ncbi:MAG: hypothetical protein MI757_06285 [Pirellulales bacterium]|nr:hypothetical protein [Pirellulales bacterium]
MIKRSRNATPLGHGRWTHRTVSGIGWRRMWLLNAPRQSVTADDGPKPWSVWRNGERVFSGTKQQCEEWLDWQDQQTRKAAG